MKPLPLQPMEWDDQRVLRFKANSVVRRLLDEATKRGYDLNNLFADVDNDEDWTQFAQLIGYSVSGWGGLSYVSDKDYARVQRKMDAFLAKEPK